ncbi:SDR family oxidoreductase [Acinetobacter pollinis]|jgi:short-subunit dehydrogenase|uniref:SDR family oxidoreductase n=2 Tax=Gammaproteobacteria TaxID=1236 RepID=A0ABU6DVK4_9GAMM|nr:SDR family oxidoreductase [Acinetobacter pollinis]MBF7691379.1 SDR family oxidoreductase [Acinetobacter pollinis]MBF7693808.1 SDR family oxidoreductase [Acinetobacter pollinis]MBF7698431.1 SDR family oxidoreductase [Acinetobacter pollinis]MBF7701392.1 SDR family oxidoreductase [Acinetobacter pollinis]MEB5477897.1 SDR family oxidoreductase [Acinetobacter pollinis]
MKKVLVTGAGSGFGKLYTIELAKRGYDVYAGVEIASQITTLKNTLLENNLKANVFKLDICSSIDQNYVSHLDLDILVNNAGIGEGGSLVDMPNQVLRNQFEVNFFSTIELTQKIVRRFMEKKSGRVVFISSIGGIISLEKYGAYCGSKHALEAAAQALKQEVEPFGVTIATINPGPYATGFNDRMTEASNAWHHPEHSMINHDNPSFDQEQYPEDMDITKMVDVIVDEKSNFRNLFPLEIQQPIKEVQNSVWEQ